MARRKQSKRNSSSSSSSNSKKQEDDDDDDEEQPSVDYAAVADELARKDASSSSASSDDANDDDDDDDESLEDDGANKKVNDNDSGDDDDDDDDSALSDDKDNNNKNHDNEKEQVYDDNDNDDDDDDNSVEEEDEGASSDEDEVEVEEQSNQQRSHQRNNNNSNDDDDDSHYTFDLRNLLALSTHPVDPSTLYNSNNNNSNKTGTAAVNEAALLQSAQRGCNELLRALWQRPVERSSTTVSGPLVVLPARDESRIPRARPPPPPRRETKWEQFAREKGIGQNKEKRGRKVWDEAAGEWLYRHGYQKANSQNDSTKWPIMEALPDDPAADPWEHQRDAKRARVDKNAQQRLKNQERAGAVVKGSAKRLLPNNSNSNINRKKMDSKRAKNVKDGNALPVGVPVDLEASGRKGNSDAVATASSTAAKQRGKTSTMAALRATQVSTASMGKFDKPRQDEPARAQALNKASNNRQKKRTLPGSATDRKVLATESERSLKLLQQLQRTGGKEKEVARQKGRLASGETAYDYEFDDGLGPSSFRKKKGRAGAGKMKKMTKKRVK